MDNADLKIPESWKDENLMPLLAFLKHKRRNVCDWPQINYVDKPSLPSPYDFLLTQPLMTMAIEYYYQRTPQIKTLHEFYEAEQHYHSRVVLMYVDQDPSRDEALLAQKMGQAVVAELAMIHINLSGLTEDIVQEIERSTKPFGAILLEFGIASQRIHNRYFQLSHSSVFSDYLACNKPFFYGRSSTLLRSDNQAFLAQVVEILP